jgi:hypothetical protein
VSHVGRPVKGKTRKITGRVAGLVTGWYWDFELDLQKSMGADVQIHKKLVWLETDKRLVTFIEKCEKIRARDYEGGLGICTKLIQNSSYGKFGSTKHEEDIILAATCPNEKAFPLLDDQGDFIEGIWTVPTNPARIKLTMVHWASYITARTRWLLMKYLLAVPREAWHYCDTDSLMIPSKYADRFKKYIGKKYGQIKLVKKSDFELICSKVYRDLIIEINGLSEKERKEVIAKSITMKGIPKKKREYAWEHGFAEVEFSRSLMVNIKAKLNDTHPGNYTREGTRKMSNPRNITCGYYRNGVWHPEIIKDQDIDLIPGLTEFERASIRKYLTTLTIH